MVGNTSHFIYSRCCSLPTPLRSTPPFRLCVPGWGTLRFVTSRPDRSPCCGKSIGRSCSSRSFLALLSTPPSSSPVFVPLHGYSYPPLPRLVPSYQVAPLAPAATTFASSVTVFHGIAVPPWSMSTPWARSNCLARQRMCAMFGWPLRSLVFLPLFGFLSSLYPFLLPYRLHLVCYDSGVYSKGFPIVSCIPVVFQSSLCPHEGGVRILRVRCEVGSIPDGFGMLAFSLAPVV